MRPGTAGTRASRNAVRPPRVMKHTSMLSALVAVRSPRRAACGAHVGLRHLADRAAASPRAASRPSTASTYDWSLRGVGAAPELGRAVGVDGAAGVVAGGQRVEAHRARPLVQAAPLDAAVALDARVRRPAGRVARDVRLDDPRVELLGEVEDVVREVELRGDAARVLDVGHRAAAGVARAAPELQRHAGDVVALVAQHRGRDRRVDPAAHRDEHPHRPASLTPGPARGAARPRPGSARGRGRRRRRSTRTRG